MKVEASLVSACVISHIAHIVLHHMVPMCCWLSSAYAAVGMLFLFDMLLLNGTCDANKQVPWRYIQPCRLAQHTVGNLGQLFLESGLKSQFADAPEVAVRFLIVTKVLEGWHLWFISWDTVMVYVIWMMMNITGLKFYSCLFHERSDNCIILN